LKILLEIKIDMKNSVKTFQVIVFIFTLTQNTLGNDHQSNDHYEAKFILYKIYG